MTQTVKELQEICAAWMLGAPVWYKSESSDWDRVDPFADELITGRHLNWRLYKVGFLGSEPPPDHIIYRVGDADDSID